MRPPGSNSERGGRLGPGQFVSRVTPHGARAGPVRRRSSNAPSATPGSSATRTTAATPARSSARTGCRRSVAPEQPIADPGNAQVAHVFHKRGDGLEVQTQVDGQVYRPIVDYAFGSGDRGVTMVGHDQEGRSFEYRLSLYPNTVGWDVTTGHTQEPDRNPALYQGKDMAIDDVRHCIECHHTNPRAILTGTGPESSDRAIGCERCHGPGGNHLKAVSSKDFASNPDADLAIGRPSLASGPAIVGLCAECHSQKKTGRKLTPGSPESIRFQGVTLTWSRCYEESDQQARLRDLPQPPSKRGDHRAMVRVAVPAMPFLRRRQRSTTPPAAGRRAPRWAVKRHARFNRRAAASRATCRRSGPTMAHTSFTDHFIRVHRESELEPKSAATSMR